jgi:hypothetical protein
MKTRLLLLAWLLLASAAVSPVRAQVDTAAAREARGALRQVERSYAGSSNWPLWSRQLRWADLAHELNAGEYAEATSLERAAGLLRDPNQFNFRNYEFQRLATALEARVAELKPIARADWPAEARRLSEAFAPIGPTQLQPARERVRVALNALENRLPALRSPEHGWSKFLSWPESRQLVSEASELPNQLLTDLETRWQQVLLVWDDPDVVEASLAVRTLIPLLRAKLYGETQAEHAAAWQSIAAAAEPGGNPAKLMVLVAVREGLAQSSPLTASMRRELTFPNAVVEISTEWFKQQAMQDIDEPYQINGFYAGAATRGNGRLNGKLELAIDRAAAAATLVQGLSAVSRSASQGGRDGVSVASRATTTISGQKLFTLDGVGLRTRPATAGANTAIAYDNVFAGGGRRGSIGTSEAYGSRSQAEADASEEAARGARSRLDGFGRQWVGDFNREYQQHFRNPWLATPQLAPVVRVSAHDGKLAWQAQLASLRGFEVRRAPEFTSQSDATLRFSSSAIEAHAAAVYGGKYLTGAELSRAMAEMFGQRAEDEPADVRVRFAARPCDVKIAGGELSCELHFSEFESGETTYPSLLVELRYKFEPRDRGVALVRAQPPKVTLVREPGDDGPLTGRQQTLRIGAQRKIAGLIGEEFAWSEVRLPLTPGEPQKFDIAALLAEGDWLQLALAHRK